MAKYAKWIGGALGWAFAGPLGGLLGYAFGSVLETFQVGTSSSQGSPRQETGSQTHPGDFAGALLALSAAVIQADGKIKSSEIEYVKKFYIRQFGEANAARYMQALELILQERFSTSEICDQIRKFMDYSSRVQLLHYLFGIAKADEHVDKSELETIFEIAMNLGLSSGDFESVQAMFYQDNVSAYRVLEVDPSASDAEIKKAYRAMAVKFHPDKVAHLGDEFSKAAHEKFQKLSEAYEQVKKERGIV